MPSAETLSLFAVVVLIACNGSGNDAPSSGAGAGAGVGGSSAGAHAAGASGKSGVGGGGASGGKPSAAGGAATSGITSYATNFELTETPISESGVWRHEGLDWTTVNTAGGIAFGTQLLGVSRSGPEGYNDSYAYLPEFPADQQASAIVALGTIDASCTHEVEVLLRWADSAHVARGYECNVAFDGSYAQIVRWNGPVGDYTYLGEGSVAGGVHDGDTVSATVVGDQITLSVNGQVRATAQDATFPTGSPGIGLWRGSSGCGTLGDYGFTSFTASPASP